MIGLQLAPVFLHMSAALSPCPPRLGLSAWVAAEPVCPPVVGSASALSVAPASAVVVVVVVEYLVVVEFVVVVDCVVVVVRVVPIYARGVVGACTFVVRAPCVGVRPHTALPPPRP